MGAPDGFSNINVLGLALVLSLCNAIIVTNLTLLPVLKCFRWYDRRRFPLVRLWVEDGILQVLRKAYEGVGVKGWDAMESDVPMIESNPPILALLSLGKGGGERLRAEWTKIEGLGTTTNRSHVETAVSAEQRRATAP